ncbi:MAG TPA: VOC family protein [Polyangiaceae bacterium]|nr:VOC family protein [Polyangiaceae bacterium]
MPEFAKPVPGNFCWTEVFLEDPARGKGFYGELFGWASKEMPGSEGTYDILHIGGKLVAGASKMPPELKKAGAPPHWLSHVYVTDANAATKKAEGLGAQILRAPARVGSGTVAIIQDPTGGRLAVWSTKESLGTFLWGEINSLCWTELTTSHPDAAIKFYVGLFGWKTEAWPMGDFTYTVLKNGDVPVAGLMPQPKEMADAPTSWTAYFAVSDCDATTKRSEKLGGTICMPPHDIPNVGRFSILADPEGATFAVIKNVPRT